MFTCKRKHKYAIRTINKKKCVLGQNDSGRSKRRAGAGGGGDVSHLGGPDALHLAQQPVLRRVQALHVLLGAATLSISAGIHKKKRYIGATYTCS